MVVGISQPETNPFATIARSGDDAVQPETDELGKYLALPPVNVPDTELLAWWDNHAAQYPQLSRMACDYLSIPGTPSFFSHLSHN